MATLRGSGVLRPGGLFGEGLIIGTDGSRASRFVPDASVSFDADAVRLVFRTFRGAAHRLWVDGLRWDWGALSDGQLKIKAIIHRDGDFISTDEAVMWADRFKKDGAFARVTAGCDVEAYFCTASHFAAIYSVDEGVAEGWRVAAAAKVGQAKDTFFANRKVVNWALFPNGSLPGSDAMWDAASGARPEIVKGRKLLATLKVVVKADGHDDKLLNGYRISPDHEAAPDLQQLLRSCLASLPVAI